MRTLTADTLLSVTPRAARETLAAWVADRGLPAYRAEQIHRRLWKVPVGAWCEASELPLELRRELESDFPLPRLVAEAIQ